MLRGRGDAIEKSINDTSAIGDNLRKRRAEQRDLKEGTEAVEEIARKDLGMIRDGESFFLIVEPQQDPDRD